MVRISAAASTSTGTLCGFASAAIAAVDIGPVSLRGPAKT